ncbi:MAG: hypothetical protein EAZ70_10975 [Runella slithyformis]|nr:MAG: hypothetical protein EAZ70_10975 [Runella slithyformis]
MQKPYYHFETSPDSLIYEFDSVSEHKTIHKVVIYEPLEDDMYHLGFGDLTAEGKVDYKIVSANQDMDKVLMTVVQTMLLFFDKYPDKKLVFVGSTESRTRLYRGIITKFIEIVELYLEVEGFVSNDEREPFRKNQEYQAFLISPKI